MKRLNVQEITDIASKEGLRVVWTTTGTNGYPKNEDVALVGFTDYAHAERVAKEYGLEFTGLRTRDGWGHWEFRGSGGKPLETTDYLGDGANWFSKRDDMTDAEIEKEFIGQWYVLNDVIENADTMDEILNYTLDGIDVLAAVKAMKGTQICVHYDGVEDCEVMDEYVMEIHDSDVHTHAIGLVRPVDVPVDDDDDE